MSSSLLGMRILLTGASGFIGSAVLANLRADSHEVIPLQRSSGQPSWDPARKQIDLGANPKFDAVIHLAGENIAQRWNAAARDRIYRSRIDGTRLLSEALARLPEKPRTFLCASGTAIYGDRGNEVLAESSSPKIDGFLAKVVRDWEAACAPAAAAGIRVVHLRFGMVTHPTGGALAKMLPPFRLGIGGKLSSGRQYLSWVTRDDAVRAIQHCLLREDISGPINVVSPQPVTNAEFTKALGTALRRPTWFTVPAPMLKLVFGEMAKETMLISFRVLPRRLQESGFKFEHPELGPALQQMPR
jgi:uncharacterized protein